MNTWYCYSDAVKRGLELQGCETADAGEVLKRLQFLTEPGRSLMIKAAGLNGYLDLHVGDGHTIEMEIMEQADDDFAIVDIAMAARVVEIAMTDTRNLSLRRKLEGLQIKWIT